MTDSPLTETHFPIERSAPAHWLRSFWLMLIWELKSTRIVLPIAIVVQILIGGGMIVGYGFLLGDIPASVAVYMATGVTVVSMITIGLVLYPQIIAVQKQSGIYDYLFSLPVPRTTSIAAGLVVSCLIALPGMFVALGVAWWRWDLPFNVKPTVLPAIVLILLTAASIGYALAHAIPKPQVTGLVTQVLVFFIILFSPLAFPPERLPRLARRCASGPAVLSLCQRDESVADRRSGRRRGQLLCDPGCLGDRVLGGHRLRRRAASLTPADRGSRA